MDEFPLLHQLLIMILGKGRLNGTRLKGQISYLGTGVLIFTSFTGHWLNHCIRCKPHLSHISSSSWVNSLVMQFCSATVLAEYSAHNLARVEVVAQIMGSTISFGPGNPSFRAAFALVRFGSGYEIRDARPYSTNSLRQTPWKQPIGLVLHLLISTIEWLLGVMQ